jgi:hypothetical protein
MFKFYGLAVFVVAGFILPVSHPRQAERLKFAWPDGASAKVQARSEGRRVNTGRKQTWDMSLDFTMQVKRTGDRVMVSRNNFSGWKGTFPSGFGGGAERFADMIPTVIVTGDGEFVGIEGHETARKLMAQAVEQSGGLSTIERSAFQPILSNASIEAIGRDHWSSLVPLWQEFELEPGAVYEFQSIAKVPQLGGGQIDINGTIAFVKETPCESPLNTQRCIHLHAETEGDKAQVRKLIQALFQRADPNAPTITDWSQQIKLDIVVEKKTMLPQYLKVTRLHNVTLNHKASGRIEEGSEELSNTYTFAWLLPADGPKKQ